MIDETIAHLRAGGMHDCETVVLWLGVQNGDIAQVREVYRPDQLVEVDRFHIPPQSVRALMGRIRETHCHIVAQVHSHPGRAYHSKADDVWAITRRVGSTSIVIPRFATDTDRRTFIPHAATYQLDDSNHWIEVPSDVALEIV